jgi:hypothetical protein
LGKQRAGHGPGVETHGDHGGHVTEQTKARRRSERRPTLPGAMSTAEHQ